MNLKRLLYILSGDDLGIINQCEMGLQNRFAIIGSLVIAIFGLCFVSSFYTFIKLFPSLIIGILVALFFALMITNIYLLLLYTLSKNVLPHIKDRKTRFFSVGFRLLFICFIAVVVSKPIEAWIFSTTLNEEISLYKQEKIQKYTIITSDFFDDEAEELKKVIKSRQNLSGNLDAAQIEKYKILLAKKEKQKEELILRMNSLVQNSNYYIQSIVILNNKYPVCWTITTLIIFIFLVPAYLKKFIPEKSRFYSLKKNIEMRLVSEEYELFKKQYGSILWNNYQVEVNYNDLFTDAPFNTVSKIDNTTYLPENDLIKEIYNA